MNKMNKEMTRKQLAIWWLTLNSWEIPKDMNCPVDGFGGLKISERDKKMFVRGAFEVVNKLIRLKEVKKLTRK